MELWWVDFNCLEVLYSDLAPIGGSNAQATFQTHVWRLRAAGTEELLEEYVVPTGTTTATVTYP